MLLFSKLILRNSKLIAFLVLLGIIGRLEPLEEDNSDFEDAKDLDVNLSGQESSPSDLEMDPNDDLFTGVKAVKKRAAPSQRKGAKRVKKERKPQLDHDDDMPDDDEDGEYVGDEEVVLREKSRSKSRAMEKVSRILGSIEIVLTPISQGAAPRSNRRRASSEISSPPPQKARARSSLSNSYPVESSAETDKTRIHIISQLSAIFKSIFGASNEAESTEEKAASFAKEVEAELFNGYSEVDPKIGAGPKGPRNKYTAKYRSLHYNLKSNALFRSRIFANEFNPVEIVTISNEELLTPELREMAESIRAASLKHSVKEVLSAPTAKRTHRGEEEIDNGFLNLKEESTVKVAGNLEMVEREREREIRERSASTTSVIPLDNLDSNIPRTRSPSIIESTSIPAALSSLPPLLIDDDTMAPPSATKLAKPRTSFDMASIWGQVKPSIASPTISNAALDNGAEEYDPFATTGDDDDLDDILSENKPKKDKGKQVVRPKTLKLEDLNPVWVGDVIVPEEGGFPSFAVQVGGESFGTDGTTWSQLLPTTLAMSGRIPTATASKYLVECIFAPTRELVVMIIQPDLTGPNPSRPDKPIASRCQTKFQHVIDFYVKKDRIGVVSPSPTLKKVVKDIYIMPLKRGKGLPEFIELLDAHLVPEKREEDLILCVLVIQKGSLPALRQKLAIPQSTSPIATTQAPLLPLSTPDLASLSSLLADPALLQSVLAGVEGQSLLNTPGLLQALSTPAIAPNAIPGLPSRPPMVYPPAVSSNRPSASAMNDQSYLPAVSYSTPAAYPSPISRNYPPNNFDRRIGSASPINYQPDRREVDNSRASGSGGRGFIHPDRLQEMNPRLNSYDGGRDTGRSGSYSEDRMGYGQARENFGERDPYSRGNGEPSRGNDRSDRGGRGGREFDQGRGGGWDSRGGR